MLTTERRLGAGPPARTGSRAPYRPVVAVAGEPHVVRRDLVGDDAPAEPAPSGPAIACFVHITDLHVTDTESPARFEFVNREWEDSRFRELLTMQRPQETLNPRAIAAMVRAVNELDGGPLTGEAVGLVALTGDAIDNTQRNELDAFLALMNGGIVRPGSGAPDYEGVQRSSWPGEIYWKPDGAPRPDVFTAELGFPTIPGLLELAMDPFESSGLRVPWLACYGNHEQVCQGVGRVTPALARAMTASRKPIALPDGLDRDRVLELFVDSPELFTRGAAVEVTPDAARRPISRPEFAAVLHESGGHGITPRNRDEGTAYYVHDTDSVRYITLDTVCDAGGADGWVQPEQLHWLERRLEEVHSTFRSRDGTGVRTAGADRLVVLLSHHGLDTLSNPRVDTHAEELRALLLRFPNVVLWLNGHIHANRITPRRDAAGGHGFWEVTTASMVDWPCQSRVVELFDAGHGRLGIACTMLDHDGAGLAGVHRELAANVPLNGFDSWRPGEAEDRNAILLVRAPFDLRP